MKVNGEKIRKTLVRTEAGAALVTSDEAGFRSKESLETRETSYNRKRIKEMGDIKVLRCIRQSA